MSFKLFVVLSALVAVSYAVVSSDGYSGVGVQTDQTVRGALNTLSSYSKSVNTPHSQSYVSRTDYTNNPGLIAHPIAPVIAAPHYGAYGHAPIAAAYGAYGHAPVAAAYGAYAHAPVAAAYGAYAHAPVAAAYGAYGHPAYAGAYKAAIYH